MAPAAQETTFSFRPEITDVKAPCADLRPRRVRARSPTPGPRNLNENPAPEELSGKKNVKLTKIGLQKIYRIIYYICKNINK